MLRLMLAVLLLLAFAQTTEAQPTIAQLKNRELVTSLFNLMTPDAPENSYLPEMVKVKLRWLIRENQAKPPRLLLVPTDKWPDAGPDAIAWNIHLPGKTAEIGVSAEAIAARAVYMSKGELKDMLFLCLTHEAIHLEVMLKGLGFQELLNEEVRTWHKWLIGAVRPLRSTSHGMLGDWTLADEILKSCQDTDCPPFVEIVRQHLLHK